jgi:ketosteroid isomerase-like protein
MILSLSGRARDGMDVQAMTAWLTALGDAWEKGDAGAATALFAPGATFQPSPFGERVRGRSEIAAHWAEAMSGQQPIRFEGEILGVGRTYGIAHWRVVIGQTGDRPTRVVDGILLAAFDKRGRATSVRSWSQEAFEQPDQVRERPSTRCDAQ